MVLKRLLSSKPRAHAKSFSIPAGSRVYAIGDIHGRLDLLDDLLARIDADNGARGAADTQLIFLGDLVDRGPDSRGVIDRLIALKSEQHTARYLLGNHDEVFLKAASGDAKATRFLTRIGGKQTILSYGLTEEEYRDCDFEELVSLLERKVPSEHLAFLRGFDNWVKVGDYLFVHAGIRPGVDIEQQALADLRWIRKEFLESRTNHGTIVVHGHSISAEPDERSNRIGIDTGAFASGRLTALGLEGAERWYVTAEGAPDPSWQALTD